MIRSRPRPRATICTPTNTTSNAGTPPPLNMTAKPHTTPAIAAPRLTIARRPDRLCAMNTPSWIVATMLGATPTAVMTTGSIIGLSPLTSQIPAVPRAASVVPATSASTFRCTR